MALTVLHVPSLLDSGLGINLEPEGARVEEGPSLRGMGNFRRNGGQPKVNSMVESSHQKLTVSLIGVDFWAPELKKAQACEGWSSLDVTGVNQKSTQWQKLKKAQACGGGRGQGLSSSPGSNRV